MVFVNGIENVIPFIVSAKRSCYYIYSFFSYRIIIIVHFLTDYRKHIPFL